MGIKSFVQPVSFLRSWSPRIPLNTDVVPIETFPPPKKVRLFARKGGLQLRKGESVKTGQRLAPDLVSPVTGKIVQVEPFRGINGEELVSLSLDVAEKEEIAEGLKAIASASAQSKYEILSALSDLGFCADWGDNVDTAVLNGLDLDPSNAVNQQALRENADALGDAIALLETLTGARRLAVAVTRQLSDLVKRAVAGKAEVFLLAAVYPNGLPEVILRKLSKKYTLMHKGLVIGADRLFAMRRALKSGMPLREKTVTFSVPAMGLCKNLLVRIGTPIADILQRYDVTLGGKSKLLMGGAMRGMPCYSPDFAVTPTTDSIYVQDETRLIEYENNPCINCGRCGDVCPVNLRVNLLCRYSEYGFFQECRALNVDECIECGLCAYTCPARRPLIHYLRLAKSQLAKARKQMEPSEVAP